MTSSPQVSRSQLSRKLKAVKLEVAQAVTNDFFSKHPEWVDLHQERGRQHCTADTCFHIDFLCGAIEADSPEAFGQYTRWTARMLASRGVPGHALDESLADLGKHLAVSLVPNEQAIVASFLQRARQFPGEDEPDLDSSSPQSLVLTRQLFIAAILAGQRQAALNIIEEAMKEGHSHVDIYIHVFTDSLHRVGKLWELNKISVAQEHMATSITQYAIASIYPRLIPAGVNRGNMVVTGVEGELHQIGANLVADSMEAKGWAVQYLGSNLPHSSVLDVIEKSSAKVLSRNSHYEEELVYQLFNSSEKRLARILLMLANFGKEGKPQTVIPKVSQQLLADMVGTTRGRINLFMNRFRKMGFIKYNGKIEVHSSLLTVVLRD